jgi:hypothetical protein
MAEGTEQLVISNSVDVQGQLHMLIACCKQSLILIMLNECCAYLLQVHDAIRGLVLPNARLYMYMRSTGEFALKSDKGKYNKQGYLILVGYIKRQLQVRDTCRSAS